MEVNAPAARAATMRAATCSPVPFTSARPSGLRGAFRTGLYARTVDVGRKDIDAFGCREWSASMRLSLSSVAPRIAAP